MAHIVAEFDKGQPVPDWLIEVNPMSPSPVGIDPLVWNIDVIIVDTGVGFAIVPHDITKGGTMVFQCAPCVNLQISSATAPVWWAVDVRVLMLSGGETRKIQTSNGSHDGVNDAG